VYAQVIPVLLLVVAVEGGIFTRQARAIGWPAKTFYSTLVLWALVGEFTALSGLGKEGGVPSWAGTGLITLPTASLLGSLGADLLWKLWSKE
jgi:hypothetical protein